MYDVFHFCCFSRRRARYYESQIRRTTSDHRAIIHNEACSLSVQVIHGVAFSAALHTQVVFCISGSVVCPRYEAGCIDHPREIASLGKLGEDIQRCRRLFAEKQSSLTLYQSCFLFISDIQGKTCTHVLNLTEENPFLPPVPTCGWLIAQTGSAYNPVSTLRRAPPWDVILWQIIIAANATTVILLTTSLSLICKVEIVVSV